jgi:hypothetical protein
MLLRDNREYPQHKGFRITILQFVNISGNWNFPRVVNDSPEISIISDLRIQVQLQAVLCQSGTQDLENYEKLRRMEETVFRLEFY